MKGVIDRFAGDYAVLLIGPEEVELAMPRKLLPKGAREGSWLTLQLQLDPEESVKQEEKIAGLLEKLKKKARDT
jgi:hypothetical protein